MIQVIEAEINALFHVGPARVRDIYSFENVQEAWEKLKQNLLNVKLDEDNVSETAKEAALETIKGELIWRAIDHLIHDDELVARQLVKEIETALAD